MFRILVSIFVLVYIILNYILEIVFLIWRVMVSEISFVVFFFLCGINNCLEILSIYEWRDKDYFIIKL